MATTQNTKRNTKQQITNPQSTKSQQIYSNRKSQSKTNATIQHPTNLNHTTKPRNDHNKKITIHTTLLTTVNQPLSKHNTTRRQTTNPHPNKPQIQTNKQTQENTTNTHN